jgi:hypothetical protein
MRLRLLLLLLSICTPVMAQETLFERVALRTAGETIPLCQPNLGGNLENGEITIHSGETVCVRLVAQGAGVTPTSVVSKKEPDVLVLRMWQEPGSSDTFLSIHNPLQRFLSYKAFLQRPETDSWEYTSSCPVLSHRSGIEHWPYSLSSLKLTAFSPLPESDQITCE